MVGTTCRSLVSRIGKENASTVKELLNMASKEVGAEEVLDAMFLSNETKGKAKLDEKPGGNIDPLSHRDKKKKKKKKGRQVNICCCR